MNNFAILVVNVILYFVTFIIYQRRKRYVGIGSMLLLMYLTISILGVDLFFNSYSNYSNLKLFPYLYLFVAFTITALPLFKIDEQNITKFTFPNAKLFNILCISAIILLSISASSVLTKLNEGISSMNKDVTYAAELYADAADTTSKVGTGSLHIFNILSGLFTGITPLLFFTALIFKQKRIIIWGLGICIVVILITPLSVGQRGGVVLSIFDILFAYIFLRKFLSKQTRKIIQLFSIVIILFISIPFVMISTGRFNNNNDGGKYAVYMAETYVAHSFIVFNNYGIYNGPYLLGDRTIPLFRRALGIESSRNLYELQNKINSKFQVLKQKGFGFHTYVGDLVFDYGNITTIIILCILSFWFWRHTKLNNTLTLHKLILIYFLFNICDGIFLFNFSDTGGNLKIIFYLFIYYIFRINQKKISEVDESKHCISSF